MEVVASRLEGTERHPLRRIPADGLSEEGRRVVDLLNTRLDALAATEKEQHQFIADVSHELRTPLTVLRGSLEVALEEERPAEEYREAIGNAILEVRHLARISQNLLFLTRGESGRVTLSFANLDLGRFVSETVKDFAPAAGDRGLELSTEVPGLAGVRLRRRRTPAAGVAQPAREQPALHGDGRPDRRPRRIRAGRSPDRGRRHGRRDSRGGPALRLREVLPQQALPARPTPEARAWAFRSCGGSSRPTRGRSRSRARSARERRSRCTCRWSRLPI